MSQSLRILQPVGNAALAEPLSPEHAPAIAEQRKHALRHPLSTEQQAQFERDGYIILRGLLADGIDEIRDACYGLQDRQELLDPNNLRIELHENKPWKIDPFHSLDPRLSALVRDRRICDGLASLYQGREPRLFKDKLIMKPPGGHGNGLHQDYNWWQGFPTSLISVLIALDPADEDNGCTELFPRHENKFLHKENEFNFIAHDDINTKGHIKIPTNPGDVVFFHCFTPHQSQKNESDRHRAQIFLTYNDSGDGEFYQAHYEHYQWYVTLNRSQEEQNKAFFY